MDITRLCGSRNGWVRIPQRLLFIGAGRLVSSRFHMPNKISSILISPTYTPARKLVTKVALSILAALIFFTCSTIGYSQEPLKEGDKIVLIFGADWCYSCGILKTTINSSADTRQILKTRYKKRIWFLKDEDRPRSRVVANWFNLARVRGYPTTIVYRLEASGFKEYKRLVGPANEQVILDFLIKNKESANGNQTTGTPENKRQ